MSANYEFSFERGQFLKVIAGLLSLMLLVFSAGILTGIALQMQQTPAALIAEVPSPAPVVATAPPVPPAPKLVTPPPEPAWEDKPAVEAASADEAEQDDADVDSDQPAEEDTPVRASREDSEKPVFPGAYGRFAVQFGAFLKPENAETLAKTLVKKGYDVDVVTREDSHGRAWYLVRYGFYQSRAEAAAAALEIKALENLDALVRPTNSM